MSNDIRLQRPLSPHLQIYKPQMTSALSILHRIAGFGLSLGLIPLAAWLWAAAYDASALVAMTRFFNSLPGLVLLFGWSVAFYYHLANGIRHLVWDTGRMLAVEDAYRGGYIVLGFTFGATLGTWAYITVKLWQ